MYKVGDKLKCNHICSFDGNAPDKFEVGEIYEVGEVEDDVIRVLDACEDLIPYFENDYPRVSDYFTNLSDRKHKIKSIINR